MDDEILYDTVCTLTHLSQAITLGSQSCFCYSTLASWETESSINNLLSVTQEASKRIRFETQVSLDSNKNPGVTKI